MNQFYNYNALVKFIVVYNNILYFKLIILYVEKLISISMPKTAYYQYYKICSMNIAR